MTVEPRMRRNPGPGDEDGQPASDGEFAAAAFEAAASPEHVTTAAWPRKDGVMPGKLRLVERVLGPGDALTIPDPAAAGDLTRPTALRRGSGG